MTHSHKLKHGVSIEIENPKNLLREIEEVLNFISEQKRLKEAPSITKTDILYEIAPDLRKFIGKLKRLPLPPQPKGRGIRGANL